MNIKHLSLAALCAVLCPNIITAKGLTPEEALARLNSESTHKVKSIADSPLRLKKTYNATAVDAPAFYIFDRNDDGFVILSADDRLPVMLASVDGATYDETSLPDNLRWWLSTYQREIEYYLQQPMVASPSTNIKKEMINSTKRVDIPQMIESKWNQGYPYNAHCPVKNGRRCYTGCVATAMAQVINYHQWPRTSGFGSVNYTYNGLNINFDFTAHTYDWAHMLPEYIPDMDPTQAQCDAVANLMYACGAAVRMSYDADQSGAQHLRVPLALQKYFGYDSKVSYLMRDYYTLRDWTARIYDELASGRPVIMGGDNEAGGHSFVCDGYDTIGLFHFNWGWGGYCDGYFALSALNPMDVGIGATIGDFNYNVDAIVNISKPELDGAHFTLDSPFFTFGDLTARNLVVDDRNVSFLLGYDEGGVYNVRPYDLSTKLGVEILDIYGEVIDTPVTDAGDLAAMREEDMGLYGFSAYDVAFSIDGYEPGTYIIYPTASVNQGPMARIPSRNGNVKFLIMNVGNDYSVTLTPGVTFCDETEIIDFVTKTPAFENEDVTISITATGMEGLLLNSFLLQFVGDHSADDYCVALYPLQSEGDETETYTFQGAFPLEAGEYNTYFKDWAGNLISGDFPLTIYSRNTAIVKVKSITLDQNYYKDYVGTSCQLNATIKPENATFKQLNWESSNPEIAIVNSDGLVRHLSPGRAEIYARAVDGSRIWNVCYVDVLPAESGIDNITSEDMDALDADAPIRVYNPQGLLIYDGPATNFNVAQLPSGLYLIIQNNRTKKIHL